jgi:hypothetical protein
VFIRTLERNQSVKIRIDGRDKNGKNTTRGIVVLDATLEEVETVIHSALKEASTARERGK